MSAKPVLGITMGDVNGVGPEILAKALARPDVAAACTPVVFGDPAVLEHARRFAPGCPEPLGVPEAQMTPPGYVAVVDAGYPAPAVHAGTQDTAAGRSAVEWVKGAVAATLAGTLEGIVTCPISKACIHQAGYRYSGHTELIAEMTGSADYRMCLFAGAMRVVHITSHLSLREALRAVSRDRIMTSVKVGHEALLRLGLERPRIAVAGLNPHAGEGGAFGNEEAREIAPAIKACRDAGLPCSGPYPPDTVFRRMRAGEFDMVVAMYHDQGHIPMKLIAMDEGVNVTLGIPIVRTSVDHGTAFDIAGRGIAREHSLCAAVTLAALLARRHEPLAGSGA
ncbi:MAG: 4-hydroxythreonine-4-phosphate dehydrogenase PdxA [Candidatus Hydrogenedentes bacterium]|nr:4-hydroxythreonine-4-phosphate dehydrogenase PdxA [Candidatus Hydrogenedentota bacterium]